jgi:predicted Zn-dependent protease
MKNFITQLAISLLFFCAVWFGLGQVQWTELLKIKENKSNLEKSLGDLCMKSIATIDTEIKDSTLLKPLEEIKDRICQDNNIDRSTIKLHLIKSSEINAFALPDDHLVIYTGIVDYCKSPEELAGVIAHEIAHIEKGHVMKSLGREIGIATLATLAGNSSGGAEILQTITSTAYSRGMENEADETAVIYLQKSDINPSGMADLMYRLSTEEDEYVKYLTIISTHPNSGDRATKILSMVDKEKDYKPVLSEEEWERLKSR